MNDKIIAINNLNKTYISGKGKVKHDILKDVKLDVVKGAMIAITGDSGAGKSTLLNIIGLLDDFYEGEYYLLDKEVKVMKDYEKAFYRNRSFGYVFQDYILIEEESVLNNVLLPTKYCKGDKAQQQELALELLTTLKILAKKDTKASLLSGGERQRVSLARALINNPPIILADECTSALDDENKRFIVNFLLDLNKAGKTIIIVTHDQDIVKLCDRVYLLKDNELVLRK